MNRAIFYLFVLLAAGLWLTPAAANDASNRGHKFVLDVEAGPMYIFRNDGRYGAEGTQYTAEDLGLQRNLILSRRVSLETVFGQRHRLILLYAPLELNTVVKLDKDIRFRNAVFREGEIIEHRYLFDGYRASYLYRAASKPRLDADIGASLQIRNAEVSFKEINGREFETENDIGLVFALKGRLVYRFGAGGLWSMLEADAFSTFGLLGDSVKGAIYDIRLSLGIPAGGSADFIGGLRLLGGGAEVKRREIDNWGNYGALTAGFRFRF